MTDQDLEVRTFVYQFFAEQARPPSVQEAAAYFGISAELAAESYSRLDRTHFFFLKPGTHSIHMANPFSAHLTDFKVQAAGVGYYANCAWDMLGIPAAIGKDALIAARCADCGEAVYLEVKDGRLSHENGLVHFLVPFRDWYADLAYT